MLNYLQAAQAAAQVSEGTWIKDLREDIVAPLVKWCIDAGGNILGALIIYIVGRILIALIKKMVTRILTKRKVDAGIHSFIMSLLNILLTVLLIVAIVGKLGVDTTSFAALLASAGVAIGMALSGNLQNFAGGLIVLLFRPFKVGDWIEAQGVSGSVREIQIFHTILQTADNKVIYVPNGALSSGTVVNYSREELRRVDWVFGVEYGSDYDHVAGVLNRLLAADKRILTEPAPFVALNALADSSVNVVVRAWVKSSDYWGVYFDMNKTVYEVFSQEGIEFPFPQVTIHQAKA